ncbi:IS3 family transposase [Aureimonas leprariae]|uniref:IS3 family transposase n=1 Tax=Plantimonas leprariae TaxID=2615207 RepID=UPI003CCE2AEC
MALKRHRPDEIITKFRQVEVPRGQGVAMADAVRQLGVSELTFYRWRKEYGGMSRDQLRQMKELQEKNERLRKAVADLTLDKLILSEAARGNFSDAVRRVTCLFEPSSRLAIDHVRTVLPKKVSERRVCRALGQHRSTQRRRPRGRDDEAQLTDDIVELARRYGRYGYRRIAALLRSQAGWAVNDKRVERIWRREGLKVPAKQPRRGRLWLADGSCIRLRAERPNHVWSYDFVEDRTHEGRKYRMLNVIDEFTHAALAIRVDRKLGSLDVIDVLSDLFILHGVPENIRSDNGSEFIAKAVQKWIAAVGAKTATIAPGSPWENGFVESFNARLRDELLDGEVFYSLAEARIIIESWRRHYNVVRPHSSLGYKPPAPEVFVPALVSAPTHRSLAQQPTIH